MKAINSKLTTSILAALAVAGLGACASTSDPITLSTPTRNINAPGFHIADGSSIGRTEAPSPNVSKGFKGHKSEGDDYKIYDDAPDDLYDIAEDYRNKKDDGKDDPDGKKGKNSIYAKEPKDLGFRMLAVDFSKIKSSHEDKDAKKPYVIELPNKDLETINYVSGRILYLVNRLREMRGLDDLAVSGSLNAYSYVRAMENAKMGNEDFRKHLRTDQKTATSSDVKNYLGENIYASTDHSPKKAYEYWLKNFPEARHKMLDKEAAVMGASYYFLNNKFYFVQIIGKEGASAPYKFKGFDPAPPSPPSP